jgi:hypothetical protein
MPIHGKCVDRLVEPFVAGEVVDPAHLLRLPAGQRLQEVQRVADGRHPPVVLRGVGGVLHPGQIPVLRVVEVGEAALDQGADEVDGQPGPLVAAQQERRVGDAVRRRPGRPVDQVAAVGGEGHAVPRLQVLAPGLGVLAGEAAHADHPAAGAVDEHQAHLEEDLELAGNGVRGALLEALGTVAPLEEEALAARRLRELRFQALDLPGGHERRQAGQLAQDLLQPRRIRILRLLERGLRRP